MSFNKNSIELSKVEDPSTINTFGHLSPNNGLEHTNHNQVPAIAQQNQQLVRNNAVYGTEQQTMTGNGVDNLSQINNLSTISPRESFVEPGFNNNNANQSGNHTQGVRNYTNAINDPSQLLVEKNYTHDGVSKNGILLQSPNLYTSTLNADRVTVDMELARRARMGTSNYRNDTDRVSADFGNFRDRIFAETIKLIEIGDTVTTATSENKFYAGEPKKIFQSKVKEEFIRHKAQELKSQEISAQESFKHVEVKQELPQQETFKSVEVEQKPHKHKFFKRGEVKKELAKQADSNSNLNTSSESISNSSQSVPTPVTVVNSATAVNSANVLSDITKTSFSQVNGDSVSTIEPIALKADLTNKEKVENFVNNYNNHSILAEGAKLEQTVGVNLQEKFYVSNDKLSATKFDVTTNGNDLAAQSLNAKKYIREDSLGYKVINKQTNGNDSINNEHSINNIENSNTNKIESLEQLLRNLTDEILSVTQASTQTRNENSKSLTPSDPQSKSTFGNNEQKVEQTKNNTLSNNDSISQTNVFNRSASNQQSAPQLVTKSAFNTNRNTLNSQNDATTPIANKQSFSTQGPNASANNDTQKNELNSQPSKNPLFKNSVNASSISQSTNTDTKTLSSNNATVSNTGFAGLKNTASTVEQQSQTSPQKPVFNSPNRPFGSAAAKTNNDEANDDIQPKSPFANTIKKPASKFPSKPPSNNSGFGGSGTSSI